jgi:hypothetical protein
MGAAARPIARRLGPLALMPARRKPTLGGLQWEARRTKAIKRDLTAQRATADIRRVYVRDWCVVHQTRRRVKNFDLAPQVRQARTKSYFWQKVEMAVCSATTLANLSAVAAAGSPPNC